MQATDAPTPGNDTDWPPEMEAELDAPPADDFDLSRLWRRVRREQAAIGRLKAYLARVTAHVNEAVARREAQIEHTKGLTLAYFEQTGARRAALPDLGTVHLTTRRSVSLDAAAALTWAQAEAREYVLLTPTLDREALKRHLLDTGEVIPGVGRVEVVTTVAFRPR